MINSKTTKPQNLKTPKPQNLKTSKLQNHKTSMKKFNFNVHKWCVRTLVAIGALLGISSCTHKLGPNPAEGVYGPPPGYVPQRAKTIEDVYGPPVENIDSIRATNEPELKQNKDPEK